MLQLVTVSAALAALHCAGGGSAAGGSSAPSRQPASPQGEPELLLPSGEAPREAGGERGWLGVELAMLRGGEPGVLLVQVLPGAPAEQAGLAAGDVILQLDGQPVMSPREMIGLLAQRSVGQRVALAVRRGEQDRLLAVVLGPQPDGEGILRSHYVGRPAPRLDAGKPASGVVQPVQGRVVVLEFWAGWCVACEALLPTLNEWHDRWSAQGLNVTGVTMDSVSEAALDAHQLGVRFGVLADPEAHVTRAYRAFALPTVFVIDRKGRVRDVMVGFQPARVEQLAGLVETLLAEP